MDNLGFLRVGLFTHENILEWFSCPFQNNYNYSGRKTGIYKQRQSINVCS
jgi:hypothetical protein